MKNISEYLASLSYPGRTIMIGNLSDGTQVIAYALMGRSSNSQNRILVFENGRIKTKLFRSDIASDTKWTLYDAVIFTKGNWVISNGDHGEKIANAIEEGIELDQAIVKLSYEDDTCSTPRIAGILNSETGDYTLAIVRKKGEEAERIAWYYKPFNGYGRIIHTYVGDGGTETFDSDPVTVSLKDFGTFEDLWDSLDENTRISLFTAENDSYNIKNKHRIIERNRIFDRPYERKLWRIYGPETTNKKLMNAQKAIQAKLSRIEVGHEEE
ncbi:MAG: IMP cyclohydrolase [Sphaerochaetaceae bacterium]|nr:IMP cyclohydrolase [Sphaerochaetaceae bacterium]